MNYYQVAFLNSPPLPLTYQSDQKINIGTKIAVQLARRKLLTDGVVVDIVDKPDFKCIDIDEVLKEYYDEQMLQTAKFISLYYICSLGEALSL